MDQSLTQTLTNIHVTIAMKDTGKVQYTVELQWLEHLWNHENMFDTRVVRANEC